MEKQMFDEQDKTGGHIQMSTPPCYGRYMQGQDAAERECDTCPVFGECSTMERPVVLRKMERGTFDGITIVDTLPAVDPHVPGAKLDHGKTRPSLILSSMPRALIAVATVGTFGAEKYSDGGWLKVENGFARYTDAMDRHRLAEGVDGPTDPESGLFHAAHLAWNALARLELMLKMEAENGA